MNEINNAIRALISQMLDERMDKLNEEADARVEGLAALICKLGSSVAECKNKLDAQISPRDHDALRTRVAAVEERIDVLGAMPALGTNIRTMLLEGELVEDIRSECVEPLLDERMEGLVEQQDKLRADLEGMRLKVSALIVNLDAAVERRVNEVLMDNEGLKAKIDELISDTLDEKLKQAIAGHETETEHLERVDVLEVLKEEGLEGGDAIKAALSEALGDALRAVARRL